jgi:hypothetical protein
MWFMRISLVKDEAPGREFRKPPRFARAVLPSWRLKGGARADDGPPGTAPVRQVEAKFVT